jgi:hypothetical protein
MQLRNKRQAQVENQDMVDLLNTYGYKALDIFQGTNLSIREKLGSGEHASTYLACDDVGMCYVVKYTKVSHRNLQYFEIDATLHMQDIGIGPGLYRYNIIDQNELPVVVMLLGRVDVTVDEWLKVERKEQELELLVENIIEQICMMADQSTSMNDIHWQNIGLRNVLSNQIELAVVLFDFDQVKVYGPDTDKRRILQNEFVQMFRTMLTRYNPCFNKNNRKILTRIVQHRYNLIFPEEPDSLRPEEFDEGTPRWDQFLKRRPSEHYKIDFSRSHNNTRPSRMTWIAEPVMNDENDEDYIPTETETTETETEKETETETETTETETETETTETEMTETEMTETEMTETEMTETEMTETETETETD